MADGFFLHHRIQNTFFIIKAVIKVLSTPYFINYIINQLLLINTQIKNLSSANVCFATFLLP